MRALCVILAISAAVLSLSPSRLAGQSVWTRNQGPHIIVVPNYCGPNRVRTTGPNRGINSIPNRVSTPLPERVGGSGATHYITGRRGGLPEWIINPYVGANRKPAKGDDGRDTESTGPPEDFTKFNRLMEILNISE